MYGYNIGLWTIPPCLQNTPIPHAKPWSLNLNLVKDTSKPVENVVTLIKLLKARRGSGKRKRFTIYKSHQYSMLGNLSRMKIEGEVTETESRWTMRRDHGMIVRMMKTLRYREWVRLRPHPFFTYPPPCHSILTLGFLRFLRFPIKSPKIQLNSTLPHPSSWLFNRNLILLNVIIPPSSYHFGLHSSTRHCPARCSWPYRIFTTT